jgi:hypothetical protein
VHNNNRTSRMDTFTFRIDPDLKAAFVELSERQEMPAGEILREYIRELVKTKQRQDFEGEARRQSKILLAAASNPGGDEADVLRYLDRAFDELSGRKDRQ